MRNLPTKWLDLASGQAHSRNHESGGSAALGPGLPPEVPTPRDAYSSSDLEPALCLSTQHCWRVAAGQPLLEDSPRSSRGASCRLETPCDGSRTNSLPVSKAFSPSVFCYPSHPPDEGTEAGAGSETCPASAIGGCAAQHSSLNQGPPQKTVRDPGSFPILAPS